MKTITEIFDNKYNGAYPAIRDESKAYLTTYTFRNLEIHKAVCMDLGCSCNIATDVENIYQIKWPSNFLTSEKNFCTNI